MSSPALAKAAVLALVSSSIYCNQTESTKTENEEILDDLSFRIVEPPGGSRHFCDQYDGTTVRIKVGDNPASPNRTYLRATQSDPRYAPYLFPILHEPYNEEQFGFHPFDWNAHCVFFDGYMHVVFSNVDNSAPNPKIRIKKVGGYYSLFGTTGCPDFLIVRLKDGVASEREYSIFGYSEDHDGWFPLGADPIERSGPFKGTGTVSLSLDPDDGDYSKTFEFELVS